MIEGIEIVTDWGRIRQLWAHFPKERDVVSVAAKVIARTVFMPGDKGTNGDVCGA